MFSAKASFGVVALLLCGICTGQEPISENDDEGWPRRYEADGNELVVYQPQIDSWKDYSELQARAALALTMAGSDEPVYGALHMSADTDVDSETMSVLVKGRNFSEIHFPNLSAEDESRYRPIVEKLLPSREPLILSVDRILAYMDASEEEMEGIKVNFDAPAIFTSTRSAILVIFLGPPRFEPVPGTTLSFATNTNWDILATEHGRGYYLLNEGSWLATSDIQKGPWRIADALPDEFQKLPEDDNWKEVAEHVPPAQSEELPQVFVSTEPAELIAIDGPPYMAAIPETALQYIANTTDDIFYQTDQKKYYLLLSGRWFRADTLEGTWTAVRDDLPDDFAMISDSHKKAHVLVSVAGTPEALDAVLLASIPTKARISRDAATLDVAYQGSPQFKLIDGTQVYYAENTPYDVFRVNDKYFCCHQGIWFESADPEGPWILCNEVPVEIYDIPPTSPMHNVTYVQVYESTPNSVEYGYTSGYTGQYVDNGLLYFGLGYPLGEDYDDEYYYWRYYPNYYAYGAAVRYDPYRGRYYRQARYYGPYGGAGRAAVYNPTTGGYARGAKAYGPRGSVYAQQAYNPYTDRQAARTGGSNIYGSWGRTALKGDEGWARAQSVSTYRGTTRHIEGSQGGEALVRSADGSRGGVAVTPSGDIYVGKDGNIYKPGADGNWSRYDGKIWTNTDLEARTGRDASYYQERARSRQQTVGNAPIQGLDPRLTSQGARARNQPQRNAQRGSYQRPVQRSQHTASRGNMGAQLNRQAQARNYGNYRANQARANNNRTGRGPTAGASRGGRGGGRRR